MLHRRALLAWLLAACLLAAQAGCTRREGTEVIRLGHGLDARHPVHQAMVFLGERLVALSSGRMRLEIYPSEQLGSERECLELLRIGSLAMTKVSASVLESFAPSFRLLGLPYLFRDRAHRFAVLGGELGRDLLLSAEKSRLRGLAFYDAGSRSFYTRDRPIRRPEDLAGLKIRTQESASAMAMVKALGGSPTPISWGELYTALQQGVVDGAENNPPSFQLSRHFEVARYYSLDEHTAVPDVLLVGTETWNRLDQDERAWLAEASVDSAKFQHQLWRRAEDEALATVKAAGVEIVIPDKAAFAAKAAPLLEKLRADADLGRLIAAVEAVEAPEEEMTP